MKSNTLPQTATAPRKPCMFTVLSQLPWGGGASLAAEDYQRLRLRTMALSLAASTFAAFGVVGSYLLTSHYFAEHGRLAIMAIPAVLGVLLLVFLVWVLLMMLKIEIARLRGLGLRGGKLGLLLVLVLLAGFVLGAAQEVARNPALIFMGVPLWVFRMLPYMVLVNLFTALYSYWVFFEEKPLCPRAPQTPVKPFSSPAGGFESFLLFLLQFYIWVTILWVPVAFFTSYAIHRI